MVLSKIGKKLKTYGDLVMFSHTLFSLPFALMSMIFAAKGLPEWRIIFWILVALFAGRNGANALNRYIDRNIDKKNPRTASRHLPQGLVSEKEVLGITILCFVIFVIAAYMINNLCFILSPVALILFIIYSYTKRFTWLCHLILGFTCAGAPVGAWIAVTGKFNITPFIIAAIVMFWVAGFDIIYGTQDIKFDRANNLYSIPAKFGFINSLWIARSFHAIMIVLLISLFFFVDLYWTYFIGIVISIILLTLEHYLVNPNNRTKMNIASYHLNKIVSIILLINSIIAFYL